MIGMINHPPESPAEFYEQRPLRIGETRIFPEHKSHKTPEYFFAPDGRRLGLQYQQSQSAESLWEETLQRSIVSRLNNEECRPRSTSFSNVSNIVATLSNQLHSPSDGSDESIPSGEESSKKSVKATKSGVIKINPRTHRKSSSPLARAGAFFSKSLPKITHFK